MNDLHTAARSGGTLRMLWALSASSLGKGLLTFALGTLTLSCGVARHAIPALGAGVLTIGLGVSFILDGVVEIAAGFALTSGAWLYLRSSHLAAGAFTSWVQHQFSAQHASSGANTLTSR